MRTMFDGINSDAATIRRHFPGAEMIMYYIDGAFAWSRSDIALFPNAVHVTVTVLGGSAKADVCDCENGDLTPESAARWVRNRKADGYERPTIYNSLSIAPQVRTATGNLVLARDYDMITADYDDSTAPVYPLAAAKQYKDTAGWDVSAVYDAGWPHRTPGTAPKPPAPAAAWPAGVVLREGARGGAVLVLQRALDATGLRGARNITADGVFGPQTLAGVRNFQEIKFGPLGTDGIAGPKTRAALGVR